ncbi:MAG TPA: phosphoglucosamine mutase [Acidimicrobiales bacterium]|nr:phosphoglucosamine mutase [Acidimicrobiales bacterium]HLM28946.1 phosphoglucosamine mutase [Acidimicrobiales bacterium]
MLRFGTDGVRGVANAELTPELALALGRVAARVLGGDRFAIGRDTRRSGPLLEAALAAGLAGEGADVTLLGVAPTPEVAWWSAREDAPAAVVSASHNPFADNGIKLFSAGGRKLPDAVEERLEAELGALLGGGDGRSAPTGAGVGTITSTDAHAGYGAAVAAALDGRRLDGLRAVVDCANGAASVVAPDVLRSLGVDVTVIHGSPDGTNINDGCGSTHPGDLQRAVVGQGADLGIAFDGDADRVLLVDASGELVDGDHLIAVCAIDRHARGALADDTVVVTVMTNLGFRLAMDARGISVVETAVGDRYVLEALDAGGYSLGGEQSGHVVFPALATTGDGLLTAVQVLDVVVRSGTPIGELAAGAMTRLPQVLRNVEVARRDPAILERIAPAVAAVESRLGDKGRVLVRPSGTEPLVRVMVEAPTEADAAAAADELVRAVESAAAKG